MIVAPPPPAGLTVSPARVELAPADRPALVRVRNPTTSAVVVDTAAAAYALGPTGRPRVVGARGGVVLVVRPRTLTLGPGATGAVAVSVRAAPGAGPGDHPELLVLATRPTRAGRVGVRLRVGVPVVVRLPGAVVRHLVLDRVRLVHRVIRVELRNLGNVVERLTPAVVRISVSRRGRIVARLPDGEREVLPGARAVLRLACPQRLRGPARVVVRLAGRAPRSWPVRLP